MLNKLIKYSIATFIVILMFLFIIGLWVGDKDFNKPVSETTKKQESETTKKQEIVTYDLHNGNYIAGKHFKAGTYDITCSGQGNVSSSNMFTGGLNIISPNEAKNIKLPHGTELKITSVSDEITVHMYKK